MLVSLIVGSRSESAFIAATDLAVYARSSRVLGLGY
jgi:hypothetical protein